MKDRINEILSAHAQDFKAGHLDHAQIEQLLVEGKINELEKLWDKAKDNSYMYWGDGSPQSLRHIINGQVAKLEQQLRKPNEALRDKKELGL